MLGRLFHRVFKTKHERDLQILLPVVEEINQWQEEFQRLSDRELQNKTAEFRERLAAGRAEGQADPEILDQLLPEAFAVVKETCRRFLGKKWVVRGHEMSWDMVPYDVQLIGAIVLHQGKIAEMVTGEGKTLVATMPLYLNALTGRGVHLVTVNDYLAQRDREWMGPIYEFLGLTVAYLPTMQEATWEEKKEAYQADITYGTNNQFGFDYLYDNLKLRLEDRVQRDFYYAIIDEVDNILIDEARTPLIISGDAPESSAHHYNEVKSMVEKLVRAQTRLVNQLIRTAEEDLQNEDMYQAGVKLLTAQRGMPKNKRLMKLLQEPGIKKLINRVEADYMREKRTVEIEDKLYFSIDEKGHSIDLQDMGRELISPGKQALFEIPDLGEELHKIETDENLTQAEKEQRKSEVEALYLERSQQIHNISQLLRAYTLYERDVEYVVQDGKILIVDEFTGRLMVGRRYSDGLHQAIEAKEGVKIEKETQTMATITLQNFFRLYEKLAGMTGTAETEASEFWEIYKLDVVVIPTNKPIQRLNYDDQVYRTRREKYNAILEEITQMHRQGRPVLVGTVSVEVSEILSRMLQRRGIKHNVLNAKYHQQEAEIIAQAGNPGAVTIATNMAGRGTDIKLGPGVREAGGLHIVGTERHEARRIDRQLRGRSGRQGDPGSSRFFLSLEDDLMRLFGSERIASIMDRIGIQEGEVIQHPLVTKSIERAQKRVEAHNFDIRKHLLEYDNVMNEQREAIYDRRLQALEGEDLKEQIFEIIEEYVDDVLATYIDPHKHPEEWPLEDLRDDIQRTFLVSLERVDPLANPDLDQETLREMILERIEQDYEAREMRVGEEMMRKVERLITLKVIDERWREHLYEMDTLKSGIGFRAYGQKDPLFEYKQEGFRMFEELWQRINKEILEQLSRIEVVAEPVLRPVPRMDRLQAVHDAPVGAIGGNELGGQAEATTSATATQAPARPKRKPVRVAKKVGRNQPCPCGSGKKYKKCCGAVA